MKKYLIIGLILVIISFGLVIYSEFINKSINIYEITNSGLKEENKNVYLNATFVAGRIADNYYVIFGDGVQYIVYVSDKEADKINNYLLDNPESSYKIEGITKLIPHTLEEKGKKFVREWLDANHHHEVEDENHSHDISTDEFYHYFGYVYLESTNINIITIVIYVTGIMGLLSIAYYINTKYKFI